MTLLENPATVCNLVLQEFIQGEAFNVDGLLIVQVGITYCMNTLITQPEPKHYLII